VVAYSCMTLPPGSEESAVVANVAKVDAY
jgi:hypothetical protein